MEKKWSQVWSDNYHRKSDIAKMVAEHSKETYKGDVYVPWAIMVNALLQLDEDAVIEKVMNENGGYVHTDSFSLETDTGKERSVATVVSHMVRVKVMFMGKEFEEIYPIQDQDYSASKIYDQNKVNKALQRCMTRVISMATGIGWNLYENVDLQFEDTTSKMDKAKKASPKPKEVKKEREIINDLVEVTEVTDEKPTDLPAFLDKYRANDKVIALVKKYNTVLSKKYEFEGEPLSFNLQDDSLDVITKKIELIEKPSVMLGALSKVVA